MNSLKKISEAALMRLFQKGKEFKDSNKGTTMYVKMYDTPLPMVTLESIQQIAFDDIPEYYTEFAEKQNTSFRFHLYSLELGLETYPSIREKERAAISDIIVDNKKVLATEHIPFYLVAETRIRGTNIPTIDRYCLIFKISEDDRTKLKEIVQGKSS